MRVVLYFIDMSGDVRELRKQYKKARYRKCLSRYHNWRGFYKGRRNKGGKEMPWLCDFGVCPTPEIECEECEHYSETNDPKWKDREELETEKQE